MYSNQMKMLHLNICYISILADVDVTLYWLS